MAENIRHVLYIDDDALMLKAAGRLVRRLKPDWHCSLVQDPSNWQQVVKNSAPPSLVISDLVMPSMRGDELLQQVGDLYPGVMRILITGDTSQGIKPVLSPIVHSMLSKPFSEGDFVQLLNASERLTEAPFSKQCRKKLLHLEPLPVLPDCIQRLRYCINSNAYGSEYAVSELAEIVKSEPSLTTRLIQLANSSYLGFQSKTSSLVDAINRLGSNVVEGVAVTMLSQNCFRRVDIGTHSQVMEKHLEVALRSRLLANLMLGDKQEAERAYLLSTLCSLGELILIEQGCTRDQATSRGEFSTGYKDYLVATSYLLLLWGYGVEVAESILAIDSPISDSATLSNVINICRQWVESESKGEQKLFLASLDGVLADHLNSVVLSTHRDGI